MPHQSYELRLKCLFLLHFFPPDSHCVWKLCENPIQTLKNDSLDLSKWPVEGIAIVPKGVGMCSLNCSCGLQATGLELRKSRANAMVPFLSETDSRLINLQTTEQ